MSREDRPSSRSQRLGSADRALDNFAKYSDVYRGEVLVKSGGWLWDVVSLLTGLTGVYETIWSGVLLAAAWVMLRTSTVETSIILGFGFDLITPLQYYLHPNPVRHRTHLLEYWPIIGLATAAELACLFLVEPATFTLVVCIKTLVTTSIWIGRSKGTFWTAYASGKVRTTLPTKPERPKQPDDVLQPAGSAAPALPEAPLPQRPRRGPSERSLPLPHGPYVRPSEDTLNDWERRLKKAGYPPKVVKNMQRGLSNLFAFYPDGPEIAERKLSGEHGFLNREKIHRESATKKWQQLPEEYRYEEMCREEADSLGDPRESDPSRHRPRKPRSLDSEGDGPPLTSDDSDGDDGGSRSQGRR